MINENFVIVGIIITIIGGSTYLIDTVRGKIQPNRVSYFLWALAPILAFFAEIHQGVGIQSLLTFIVGFIPAVIFIASFLNKKSYWKLEKLDLLCGALSLLGLFLWFITQIGNIAIVFSILADALASMPTVIKAYKEPQTESPYGYLSNGISAIITLLTVKNWNFQNYAFPIYILFMMGSIGILVISKVGKTINKFR